VGHAEASARTVDAAVTAAAAQLGLRSDQVDVEVLEDPVPSTFGFIGTPARVRVTPRTPSTGAVAEPGGVSVSSGVSGAAEGGSAGEGSPADGESAKGGPGGPAGGGSAGGGSESSGAGAELRPTDHPSTQEPSSEANVPNDATLPSMPGSVSAPSSVPTHPAATETGNGQARAEAVDASAPAASAPVPSAVPPDPASTVAPDRHPASTPATPPAAGPEAASSLSSTSALSTPEATASASSVNARPSTTEPEPARRKESGSSTSGARSPRRTYKDEPIEPQMVEEDTERAGDFLEGLLDAMDVDGDITTWVDDVGGHIDLEGTDLDVLVGNNGETLDALQELTRLAVLRQSKRRVRLLIDINGFRARQREQLTSMVRATVEQVLETRQDQELQPMSPAERKIVHDAVAAIEGARTESLGEEPNRRVVIRPA
jgi:spoIIIJ-associated protein